MFNAIKIVLGVDGAEAAATNINKVSKSLGDIGPAANSGAKDAVASIEKLSGKVALMGHIGAALTVGPAVLSALKDAGSALVSAQQSAEKLNNTLGYSVGAANVAKELDYLRSVTRTLGIDFNTSAQAYGKFSAATRDSGISAAQTRTIFEGVAQASAKMGLSADETQGAFLALSQMASKGTVSAEEMRGQLAERLPGAMAIAAKAMGVTEKELGKLMETGQLMASDFLPKFGQALKDNFQAPLNSLTQEINRINSAWDQWKQSLANADGGGFSFITNGLNESSAAMRMLGNEAGIVHKLLVAIGGFQAGAMGVGKFDTKKIQDDAIAQLAVVSGGRRAMEGRNLNYLEQEQLADLKRQEAGLRSKIDQLGETRGQDTFKKPDIKGEYQAQQAKRKEAFESYIKTVQSEKDKSLAEENGRWQALTAAIGTSGAQYDRALIAHNEKVAEIKKKGSGSEEKFDPASFHNDNMIRLGKQLNQEQAERARLTNEASRANASMAQTVDNLSDAYARQNAVLSERGMSVEERELATALRQVEEQADRAREALSAKAATLSGDNVIALESFRSAVVRVGEAEATQAEQARANHVERLRQNEDWKTGFNDALTKYQSSSRNVAQTASDAFTKSFASMEDALVQFATTGKISFGSLAQSIIADIIRMQARAAVSGLAGVLGKMFGGSSTGQTGAQAAVGADINSAGLGGFAKGGVFNSASLHSYANQVHDTPKFFKFAQGGVFGEAGPEAIMPLSRGSDGKLGVKASGGGAPAINIIINNTVSDQATATASAKQNGSGFDINVLVAKAIADDQQRNGPITRGFANTFGMNRSAA